jgi:hypothetical protein
MRRILRLLLAAFVFSAFAPSTSAKNFELLFDGHGDIESYIYFQQDADFFIDAELNGSVETFRYKGIFFNVDLFKETNMGRKYNSNMVFDPSRVHWSYGLSARIEKGRHFYEAQIHHDCFHSIDRWDDNSIYWNSPRLVFGSLDYLPKYKYHMPEAGGDHLIWKNKLDYYFLVSFFAPRGISYQKNHNYEITFNTDFRYQILRYKRIGAALDSYNLWVATMDNDFERQHRLDMKFLMYGNKGVLEVFFRYWPFDNQSIRSRRDHKWAFGIHFGF